MKILMINGSPHEKGNTHAALSEMEKIFIREGVETETVHVGNRDIRGCIGCRRCMELGRCVFDDCVNEIAEKFRGCDGLVVGTPVYYARRTERSYRFLTDFFTARPLIRR